jgi:hypothetical protein
VGHGRGRDHLHRLQGKSVQAFEETLAAAGYDGQQVQHQLVEQTRGEVLPDRGSTSGDLDDTRAPLRPAPAAVPTRSRR